MNFVRRCECVALRTGPFSLALSSALPPRFRPLADFKVQYPDAETGEFAIEPLGEYGHDPLAAHNGELSSVQEFEYGVNSFWRTELELEQQRDAGPGQSIHFSQVTWENIFQFTERGEYWVDSRIFLRIRKNHTCRYAERGHFWTDISARRFFQTINTVNLFMEKDVGVDYASGRPAFLYAWETRIALGTPIEPGFQAYGQPSSFPGIQLGMAPGQSYRPAAVRHHQ